MKITGVIIKGYRIASGDTDSSPYPEGAIVMQAPHFKMGGLDISCFYPATVNVSLRPYTFRIIKPLCTLENIEWSVRIPPETFSFAECVLEKDSIRYDCLVYYPHPETKPDHFQDPSTIELLAPYIDSLAYGDSVILDINPETIRIS